MNAVHREDIVLFNVLNQEVVFEEYFCNLLRIDDFRQVFLDFISEKNNILSKECIQYNQFNTEIILNNECGRADIFLNIDDKKRFIFEIKNKDYTSLTINQPQSYLKYLQETHEHNINFNKHLFFLIPKNYQHQYELFTRWKNFNEIENQIFYWQDLIYKIKANQLDKQSIEIQMFCQFCDYWFNMKQIIFSEEEKNILNLKGKKMSDDQNLFIPTIMQKLEKITTNIGLNAGMQEDKSCLGFYYSIKINNYVIWFGIDYDIWQLKGFPLSLLIQNTQTDYQYFELELPDIALDPFTYNATSTTEQSFGYIVKIADEIGSETYQKIAVDTIHIIKNLLKSK